MSDETLARRLDEARAFGAASESLASSPELSARSGLSPGQRFGGFILFCALTAFFYLDAVALGAAAITFFSTVFSLLIVLRIMAAVTALLRQPQTKPERVADADLPVMTLLVPLYKEAEVVTSLIDAILALDYPPSRLDVKLLIEADDDATLQAVLRACPPDWFEVLPVPPGLPRTKPKALNYGLAFSRGDIVAVFDAEDRPSPEQLREAAHAFRTGPRHLAVVQAPLQIHNGAQSWLTRQFEIEYAIYFRVWLPFLARLGLPLALGGTSNYFRRDQLEKVGGWDAWNVTEDADLGMRLARFGFSSAMITEPTLEEAPHRLKAWMNQRTRWMKGHIQTWLVANRRPFSSIAGMGVGGFLSIQLTLGGSLLTSMLHAPMLAWLVVGLFTPYVSLEGWHAVLFGVGYLSVVLAAFAARATLRPWAALILLPLYWPLLSCAMLRALWEMKTRPFFWAKTMHGLAPAAPAAAH